MPGRDIIAIWASAGGVEALSATIGRLPADLPAAVFVVLHTPPYRPSYLPEVLGRLGTLPVAHAQHGEAIRPGRISVAPPDRHLIVREGVVELSHGPRENRSRPAIDPTFRSAARAYGPRVVGVVLSGTLGDGTAGLMAIKARGGVTITQDPREALFDGMPDSAIRNVGPDHILPAAEIASLLARLAREPVTVAGAPPMPERAPEIIQADFDAQVADSRWDQTTVFACPECGGVLWQIQQGRLTQFHCHVGHTYSPEALLAQKSEDLEAALWSCLRMLTEKALLTRQLAERTRQAGRTEVARRIDEQAELDEKHARVIRESLLESMPNPTSQLIEVQRLLESGESTSAAASGEGAGA